MKPYDKKDNDTYVDLYSYNMATDVEIHMFKSEKGHVSHSSLLGNVIGDFSVESRITADQNILHFETAKDLNLKSIKSKDIETLIPLSLMKRYKINLNKHTLVHKTPIFFNNDTEKFVIALDNRFLRDLKEYPEFKESLDFLLYETHISIVKSNEEEQMLFNYDSIDDLYSDKTNALKTVKEAYLKLLLTIYPCDEVIIIAYNLEENKQHYFKPAPQLVGNNIHEFANSNIQFEFVKARKITDTYFYLYNSEGELNTKENYHFDKEKQRKEAEQNSVGHSFLFGKNSDLIVMPYTDYDWNILHSLKDNIDSIFSDLDKILLTQKTTAPLDFSISQIETNSHFLLSDTTKSKPQLK